MFIGSSSEGLNVANALKRALKSSAEVRVWSDAFDLGESFMESLNRELNAADYAVLVVRSEDLVRSRGREANAPRDNVVFEAGLFMGRLGTSRTFLLCDQATQTRLPSDWAGITVASYDSSVANLDDAVSSAAKQIERRIQKQGFAGEIDFLRSYLTIIRRDVRVGDNYADILTQHLSRIREEVNRLQQDHDYHRLLEIKVRLREYFEYSSNFLPGVEFGRAYLAALNALGMGHEADWVRVKDIGYMLILAGKHEEGRQSIAEVLSKHGGGRAVSADSNIAELLFYAHRYTGISYQRDVESPDVDLAAEHFDLAQNQIKAFAPESEKAKGLTARILRNIGNVLLARKEYPRALELFDRSLAMFRDIRENEHVAFGHLAKAQAIIRRGSKDVGDALTYLRHAEPVFVRKGIIEGHGRVLQQQAKCYLSIARQLNGEADRRRMLEDALAAARSARSVFERMHSERWKGEMDGLIRQIQDDM